MKSTIDDIKKLLGRHANKTVMAIISRPLADEARKALYKELNLDMPEGEKWAPKRIETEHLRDQGGEREDNEI
jgi:hypothetical protein